VCVCVCVCVLVGMVGEEKNGTKCTYTFVGKIRNRCGVRCQELLSLTYLPMYFV
jgi:hypothetical protein